MASASTEKTKPGRLSIVTLRISITAVFLALAVVSKLFFSINIPLLGAGGMKVGMAGVFTAFPAFLFGPIYGGMTSALSDILGYLVKPDGSYIPWLTLTAFLGGCIKGLLWQVIVRFARRDAHMARNVRLIVFALLICIGVLGLSFQLSLNSDGVMNGLAAVQEKLPTRGAIEQTETGPLSSLIVSLAKYNNDTFTLTRAADSEDGLVVPSYVSLDGHVSKLTKVGPKAFSDCASVKTFYLPETLTTIDDAAFEGLSGFTIAAPEGSKAKAFAEKNGYTYVEAFTEKETTEKTLTFDGAAFSPSGTEADGFTVKSSDTFRKYLAGYANFATIGLELVALAGILFVLIDWLLESLTKKHAGQLAPAKDGQKKAGSFSFMMIFCAIFVSGLIVTTINTEILKYFLAAWNGREFMILWIPRAIEEMVVCLIQAYLISILYGVYLSRIAGRGRFASIDRNFETEKPVKYSENAKAAESAEDRKPVVYEEERKSTKDGEEKK